MLTRAHSLLGVFPLGAFLVFHLHRLWPAVYGREAFIERAPHGVSRAWTIPLVILPLAAHAALGLRRTLRDRGAPADARLGPPALRFVQAGAGALALAFVLSHVVQVWGVERGPHASEHAVYWRLWSSAGQMSTLCVYLIGISAVCFHFAHGLARAAVSFELVASARAAYRVRWVAGAVGFALWLLFLQVLAHFALGAPLLRFI